MSTTFAVDDDGSVVQAERLNSKNDSILYSRHVTLTVPQVRHKVLQRRRQENPNTPMVSKRRVRSAVPDDDASTVARCREALRWITTLPEGAVRVSVNTGRVKLEGTVRHQTEREVAEDTVRQLDGVAEVENLLAVR